jgi:hypothetical protein
LGSGNEVSVHPVAPALRGIHLISTVSLILDDASVPCL